VSVRVSTTSSDQTHDYPRAGVTLKRCEDVADCLTTWQLTQCANRTNVKRKTLRQNCVTRRNSSQTLSAEVAHTQRDAINGFGYHSSNQQQQRCHQSHVITLSYNAQSAQMQMPLSLSVVMDEATRISPTQWPVSCSTFASHQRYCQFTNGRWMLTTDIDGRTLWTTPAVWRQSRTRCRVNIWTFFQHT